MKTTMTAILAAACCAAPAFADTVAAGTVAITASDPTQFGRLSRNSVPQTWTNDEPFPGILNPGSAYSYTTMAVSFAPNTGQDVYYDIGFDETAGDMFASAYLNSYDPTKLAANWIGDMGYDFDLVPGDELFFDVVVPTGNSLVLVFNSTNGTGATAPADFYVNAYSDTEYDSDFPAAAAVPEPASWAMMIAGFGLIGGGMRRRIGRDVRAA